MFLLFFVFVSIKCDIFSFNFHFDKYESSCLYSFTYSESSYKNIVGLYQKHIDPNFKIENDRIQTINKIIHFFVQNKIDNSITRFVYSLTNNQEIARFINKNIESNEQILNKIRDKKILKI